MAPKPLAIRRSARTKHASSRLRRNASKRHAAKSEGPTRRSSILEHIVAFSGALLVVLVVTKALRVAHMDLTTAQVLLVNGNVASVISGVMLLLFPALIFVALLGALFLLTLSALSDTIGAVEGGAPVRINLLLPVATVLLALALIAVPASVLLQSLTLAGIGIVPGVLIGYFQARRRDSAQGAKRSTTKKLSLRLAYFIWTFAAFVPVIGAVLNDVAWLPPERLKIDHERPFVAYEISRNDDRVLLLLHDTRRVKSVNPDDIASQQPCRLTELINSGPSVWALVFEEGAPATPAC